MNAKLKISVILISVFALMFILIVTNVAFSFKDASIKSATDKANLVSQLVKDGLTAHMVNGIMDKREYFIKQIENTQNIQSLKVFRAKSVIEQYGTGFNEHTKKDKIDLEVLQSGESKVVVEDTWLNSSIRVTIPYIAHKTPNINCIACHTSKDGDILGAVTMQFDLNEEKVQGIKSTLLVIVSLLIIMGTILYIINYFIKPYMNTFDKTKEIMKYANRGDYSKRLEKQNMQDVDEVVTWINNVLQKLEYVLGHIQEKIDGFLTNKNNKEVDPLLNVRSAISQLSDIYKFRNAIEHDENLDELYKRIEYVIKSKLDIKNFMIIECDTLNGDTKVVLSTNPGEHVHCLCEELGCRADRTNSIVNSYQFENICDRFTCAETENYICVPYPVSNDLDIIVSMKFEKDDNGQNSLLSLPYLDDYMSVAKAEIVNKKLTHILQLNARIDPLTQLFNRRYLEEYISTVIEQAKRKNISYGVLLLDIDHFKQVNDTYGHDVGDETIRICSQNIKENIRKSDVGIRYGGEEFLVLLYDCHESFMQTVAKKLRESFENKKVTLDDVTLSKTISVGCSYFPKDSDDFEKCIKYADMALYEAKNTGRNKVVKFYEGMSKED
jgi:diguanylate cyclase (GGDEF)-like protein